MFALKSQVLKDELDKLREQGKTKVWSSTANLSRRNTFMNELTRLGIKDAEELAISSVRNGVAFLITVVGVTGVVAVAAGQLPSDWGFFVPYLVGSLSLVVLAVGSVAPGLFQVAIDKFSSTQGDYQERILRHEAAHFLTAYMVGIPIVGYSLDLGKEHVNLVDESVEKRIYEGLDANLLDRLAVVSMAGTENYPLYPQIPLPSNLLYWLHSPHKFPVTPKFLVDSSVVAWINFELGVHIFLYHI